MALLLLAAASTASTVCNGLHVCMGGHMQHPPYEWKQHLLDLIAPTSISVAALVIERTSLPSMVKRSSWAAVLIAWMVYIHMVFLIGASRMQS